MVRFRGKLSSSSLLRAAELLRITESPYEKGEDGDGADESGDHVVSGLKGGDRKDSPIKTYPSSKKWTDLLLDIAMTTAFNSLTSGTSVLDRETCVSYLLFFTLVWWIWASQVAYDVRFRKTDWIHRLAIFFQFIIFCALAAFTKDFDIGFKIASNPDEATIEQLEKADDFTDQELSVAQFREDRLPVLNARGISLVMALSRLLLLLQYMLPLIYARSRIRKTGKSCSLVDPRFRALHVHIASLALSSFFSFIAFGILRSKHGEDAGTQKAKIVLWYLPLLLELAVHFRSTRLAGHVEYPFKRVFDRSSDVFVIILGGGLDRITEGFQLIAGNVSIGKTGFGLIFCGIVIFLGQFALYFGMTEGKIKKKQPRKHRRVLFWFFFNFVYIGALIVMLQAIAALLKFGNIGKALALPANFVQVAEDAISNAGTGNHIADNTFSSSDVAGQLQDLGLSASDAVEDINSAIDNAVKDMSLDTSMVLQVSRNAALQDSVIIISVILENFEASPDENSLLAAYMDVFIDADPSDTAIVTNTAFSQIFELAFTSEAVPALWFYGAAGITILALSILGLIKWWDDGMDNYEWALFGVRFTLGTLTCWLTLLDIHQGNRVFQTTPSNEGVQLQLHGSKIWVLASKGLIIPTFAILMILEQIAEVGIVAHHQLTVVGGSVESSEPADDVENQNDRPGTTGRQPSYFKENYKEESQTDAIVELARE